MIHQRSLDGLSTELLLKIFGYLDVYDLCRLKQTCKRLDEIINCWSHVLLKYSPPLVTNQRNTVFSSTRCMYQLNTFEKCRISKNWQIGRYDEKALLYVKRKYMPRLYLTNKSIWISRGKNIYNYRRTDDNINVAKPYAIMYGRRSRADVGHFQLKNDLLLSGQRDGSMWLSSVKDRRRIFEELNCHRSDINSVDISSCGSYIVSGSRDNCLKLWKVNYGSQDILKQTYCEFLRDRVWKVSILDGISFLAVGTSGNECENSLFIYDMKRMSDPIKLPSTNIGLGVLDVRWDGPHTIWSCGYDCCVKRWDLRSGRCEQKYYDPHASALYCLDYDYCNTIMAGTQLYGRVILWDVRQKDSIQLFFMESCKHEGPRRTSPIYSLAFDSRFLFTATDQNLNVLDFSIYDGAVKDYSDCCK